MKKYLLSALIMACAGILMAVSGVLMVIASRVGIACLYWVAAVCMFCCAAHFMNVGRRKEK